MADLAKLNARLAAISDSLLGPPLTKGFKADKEEVSSEEAGGLPLETRGGKPLMIPVKPEDKRFTAARDALLAGGRVTAQQHTAKSHGRGEVRRTVERSAGEGLVERFEVRETRDEEGEVTNLQRTSKGVERDRTATFGSIVSTCSHAPYFTGAANVSGTMRREVKALQQADGRLRVITAWWDEDEKRIANTGTTVGRWHYRDKQYATELTAWKRAEDHGDLVPGFEDNTQALGEGQ